MFNKYHHNSVFNVKNSALRIRGSLSLFLVDPPSRPSPSKFKNNTAERFPNVQSASHRARPASSVWCPCSLDDRQTVSFYRLCHRSFNLLNRAPAISCNDFVIARVCTAQSVRPGVNSSSVVSNPVFTAAPCALLLCQLAASSGPLEQIH